MIVGIVILLAWHAVEVYLRIVWLAVQVKFTIPQPKPVQIHQSYAIQAAKHVAVLKRLSAWPVTQDLNLIRVRVLVARITMIQLLVIAGIVNPHA